MLHRMSAKNNFFGGGWRILTLITGKNAENRKVICVINNWDKNFATLLYIELPWFVSIYNWSEVEKKSCFGYKYNYGEEGKLHAIPGPCDGFMYVHVLHGVFWCSNN